MNFKSVSNVINFPAKEADTISFWKDNQIFQKSLSHSDRPIFTFYEGPPTANGMPHNGHVLTRAVKDIFPRYKTMKGFHVPRLAGWDTHGLPVELEVEKYLNLHGKSDIEQFGIQPFTQQCLNSVFQYTQAWESLTEKIGFWVDMNQAYVTYHQSYIESEWWALSKLFKQGLLYQSNKIVWWWAQGGTALSAAEVNQGYRLVEDPSILISFPLTNDPNTSLLVWTTTPWTLPSNMYVAVNPTFTYSYVQAGDKTYIVAHDLLDALQDKIGSLNVIKSVLGSDLVGLSYVPPFYHQHDYRVVAADFITLDGSGLAHIAPAFGEDDYRLYQTLPSCPLLCHVLPNGTFDTTDLTYQNKFVKSCDPLILKDLANRNLLIHSDKIKHDYPFCPRAENDPLIQYARPAWYIKTTAKISQAIENNQYINWIPENIKDGRFGDFLKNNVDWALSRERYWGTPLNIWVCNNDSSHQSCPSSLTELESWGASFSAFEQAKLKDPALSSDLKIHKPYIDQVSFPCHCGGTMHRVPDVIDCWFDSGCMPFAQFGYPHLPDSDKFIKHFPADFISEAIDQTRGWFYSLLMVSSLLFPEQPFPHPFKNCIVLGHVCDKEGKKESKSKGNYTPPDIILDKVRLEFAVVSTDNFPTLGSGVFISKSDYDGLDLPGTSSLLSVYSNHPQTLTVQSANLPRRIIAVSPELMNLLQVSPMKQSSILPSQVSFLPSSNKLWVEDSSMPAPGADAFRWFFYSTNPSWSNTRYTLSNVRRVQKDFLVKLRNVYSFFTIYANIDLFKPSTLNPTHILDKWILSELHQTVKTVNESLDNYQIYEATQSLSKLVENLSNWYVRQSRNRFWAHGVFPDVSEDKRSAYNTLYEVLTTLSRLLAPFTPFFAEELYQNLVRNVDPGAAESIHLTEYPADISRIDTSIYKEMESVRNLVLLGHKIRAANKLKVRQPLSSAYLVSNINHDYLPLIQQELNVLNINVLLDDHNFVDYILKPNFKLLGKKLGKFMQLAKPALAKLDARNVKQQLESTGSFDLLLETETFSLNQEEVEFVIQPKVGFAAEANTQGAIILDIKLNDFLLEEGLVLEVISYIQGKRKEMDLDFTDKINLSVDSYLLSILSSRIELLRSELLVNQLTGLDLEYEEITLNKVPCKLGVKKL